MPDSNAFIFNEVTMNKRVNERGCRLEIITDQDPCKSDLELFFGKSFNADNFYFYAD